MLSLSTNNNTGEKVERGQWVWDTESSITLIQKGNGRNRGGKWNKFWIISTKPTVAWRIYVQIVVVVMFVYSWIWTICLADSNRFAQKNGRHDFLLDKFAFQLPLLCISRNNIPKEFFYNVRFIHPFIVVYFMFRPNEKQGKMSLTFQVKLLEKTLSFHFISSCPYLSSSCILLIV